MSFTDYNFSESGVVAVDATADAFIITPAVPIDVRRWGLVVTIAVTGTAGVIAVDHRITAGSDTGRVNAYGTKTLRLNQASMVAGQVLYVEPDNGPLEVNPGEQLVFQVTAAATAGDGVLWAEYDVKPFSGARVLPATRYINAGA